MKVIQVGHSGGWSESLSEWVRDLKKGDIILLKGEMAAGKTTMVRSILETWGFSDVASPTYALHHRYENQNVKVDHWDLYRLKNLDELETASFWDMLADADVVSFVEWPNLVPLDYWPLGRRIFSVDISKETNGRRVEIKQL